MKVLAAMRVIFFPLIFFVIESIQENNNDLSDNPLTLHNGNFRRNQIFQRDVVRPNPGQMLDVLRPSLVQRDVVPEIIDKRSLISYELEERELDFFYWNSVLGINKPVKIELGNEKTMINNWLQGKPLKVITHGWQSDDNNDDGVFAIKKAYVTVGGFNVITVDWSTVANSSYMKSAYLTVNVGQIVAKLLKNVVKLGVIKPSDIHVIGHSLGAHVSGACGAAFSPEKIGRITGLDPARPEFEYQPLTPDRLDSTDAQFVDVIHTDKGFLGYEESIGSIDFYPNGGSNQPGCLSIIGVICCHARSYKLYADSVYHRNSLIAVKCESWDDFEKGVCKSNIKTPMGHDADPKMKGNFYLKTKSESPYGILDTKS